MSKSIKIFLSVLALISIGFSSFIIFNSLNKDKFEEEFPPESESISSSRDDINYLSFSLPPGSSVESNYEGLVTNISKDVKPFEDIDDDTTVRFIFIKVNENFLVQYTIVGDVLVEMGDLVIKGSKLAIIKEGQLKAYDGANLVIEAFDKNDNIIPLSEQ